MKNKDLYKRTVDILVQAYFNDTLIHGNCCACAVGNLIAANNGFTFIKKYFFEWRETNPEWPSIHLFRECKQIADPINYDQKKGMEQLLSTGYTIIETAAIEYSFEKATGNTKDERMFNGLMAVIEVLDKIHENTDTEITAESKQRFAKS